VTITIIIGVFITLAITIMTIIAITITVSIVLVIVSMIAVIINIRTTMTMVMVMTMMMMVMIDDDVASSAQKKKNKLRAPQKQPSKSAETPRSRPSSVASSSGQPSSGQKRASTTQAASAGAKTSCKDKRHILTGEVQQGRTYVKTMTDYITQFASGGLLAMNLRQLQAVVKNMKESGEAVKKFIKAWGKSGLPSEISELPNAVEAIDEIVSFCKTTWPKLSAFNGKQASDATNCVRMFLPQGQIPGQLGREILRNLMEQERLTSLPALRSTTSKNGVGMLPESEQEAFIIKQLHKVSCFI